MIREARILRVIHGRDARATGHFVITFPSAS
jgi:hypothetical protein